MVNVSWEYSFKAYGGHNIDIVGKCNMILSLPKKNLRISGPQNQ